MFTGLLFFPSVWCLHSTSSCCYWACVQFPQMSSLLAARELPFVCAEQGSQEAGEDQAHIFAAPLFWWLFHSTKLVTDVLWVQEISISEASSMKLATGLRSRSGNSLYSPFPSSGRRGGSPIPRVSRGSDWVAGAASGTTVPLADGGWRIGFSSRGGSRKSFGSSAFPAASPEGSSSNKESRGLALYWISCISEGKINSSNCFTDSYSRQRHLEMLIQTWCTTGKPKVGWDKPYTPQLSEWS